jgi:DNA repair protein RecN (Recombination protein N)
VKEGGNLLRELRVRDLALIDEAVLEFGEGLNVLTGETGAGKTVLVEALGLILGGRGDAGLVRAGAEKLELEAAFDVGGNREVHRIAGEEGIEVEGEVIIRRVLGRDGKGRCYVNGRLCTVKSLARLGECLVEIHGQNEHQRLLKPGRHLEYLDRYGGEKQENLLAEYRKTWREWRESLREWERTFVDEGERLREIDVLRFQIREIEDAAPREGEMEELLQERRRIQNREEIFSALKAACLALGGSEEEGALDAVGRGMEAVEGIVELVPEAESWVERLTGLQGELAEMTREMADFLESMEIDPARAEEVERRLSLLGELSRKYGGNTAEVLAYLEKARHRLRELEGREQRQEELQDRIRGLEEVLAEKAKALGNDRRRLAAGLEEAVNRELEELNMKGMRFRVEIEEEEGFGPDGRDRVEFMISPGKGLPFRPIGRIASGGELSRIMLALKLSLARADAIPTLVFDEVDAGIGGATADVLAEKLCGISRFHQVFCITHLPQIAARSGLHLCVTKRETGRGVVTEVQPLGEEERVDELVRMLGGDRRTAREHALSLLGGKENRRSAGRVEPCGCREPRDTAGI